MFACLYLTCCVEGPRRVFPVHAFCSNNNACVTTVFPIVDRVLRLKYFLLFIDAESMVSGEVGGSAAHLHVEAMLISARHCPQISGVGAAREGYSSPLPFILKFK